MLNDIDIVIQLISMISVAKKTTGIGGECSGAKLGARGRLGGLFVVDSGFPIWRFPKIEVPPKSSISRWIFHHKPSMLGSPHWKIPYVKMLTHIPTLDCDASLMKMIHSLN